MSNLNSPDYAQHQEDLPAPQHNEIRIKFETLRSLENQEAMSMENQGEGTHGTTIRSMQGLETNGQRITGNGNVTSSTGEPVDARNIVITSTHNGNHHSEDCGSPEMQHQMPPTPITPNTNNGTEVDLSRVKVEPEAMNVIVKQEVISSGQGGENELT